MDAAVSQQISAAGVEKIELFGFSGGGAIAALIAVRRSDVTMLVTVAGVLDHEQWTELQRVSPLTGSLNPIDKLDRLAGVEQRHFVGEEDKVVPSEIGRSFVDQAASSKVKLIVVPDQNHHCCWDLIWPELLDKYIASLTRYNFGEVKR